MQLQEQQDNVEILRYMLAELLEKQSSVKLTPEQRSMHQRGIQALKAALFAIEMQVYA